MTAEEEIGQQLVINGVIYVKQDDQSSKDTEGTATDSEQGTGDATPDEATPTEKKEKGSICSAKDIYRSNSDDDGEWTWVTEYPKDAQDAAENEETEQYALVIRNQKSTDSRKKLEAHSLVVQSPFLKKALGEILDDYPGVTCELDRLIFGAPFQPFVHRWDSFLKYMKRTDLDETTKEHLTLLYEKLQYEIGDTIKSFEDYVLNGVITFESLWMIFPPGKVILSAHKGPLSAFELIESEYIKTQCGHFLKLRCDCVDWDGSKFGRYTEEILVAKFAGTKKIGNLNAIPFSFYDGKEAMQENLTKRGKRFEELAGHQYKAYEGAAITWDDDGNEKAIQISGRIIVDAESFNRYQWGQSRYLEELNEKDFERIAKHRESNGIQESPEDCEADPLGLKSLGCKRVTLSPYHQMLCRSRVRGYSLKIKKWLDFFVATVSEIKWNDQAFDRLVLPEDQKDMVLAFSESQVLNRDSFDDVIAGKGRGIIMLLSGPPGVGKTLTAEAVSEHMHCPLHSITSGDLGSSAYEVERALTKALDLVSRWNAVLLIDECDVFLQARTPDDLYRNQMVSIFLRTLEYYEGILFMTTNRVDNIDAAFESRIHVSLPYPDLTDNSRRQIWANFLASSTQAHAITDKDLDDLCTIVLNGRQIKNVLKTAQLLAIKKKQKLNMALVDTVLNIQKKRPEMKKA